MFHSASAFNQDISSWTGSAATSAQTDMFLDATAFQAKFTCTDAVTGPASSCVGPSPIPDASWHTFVGECLDESERLRDWRMYRLGSIARRLVRDDAELGYEFGGRYAVDILEIFKALGNSTFNGDISKWDTGKVTDMESMFSSASAFNQTLGVGTQRK